MNPMPATRPAALFAVLSLSATAACAQGPEPTDGRWRGSVGAGLSASSGNTRAQTWTVDASAGRATPDDRWSLTGKALYARSAGVTSGEQVRLGARHDWNLGARAFAFAGALAERDAVAELASRLGVNGGLGYKLIDDPAVRWDVFGGLGGTAERYTVPRTVDGEALSRDAFATVLVGEESSHTFSAGLSARQRFVAYPNLRRSGEWRCDLDAGLVLALTDMLGLNVGLTMRYDSAAPAGTDSTDTLLTTGLTYRFE